MNGMNGLEVFQTCLLVGIFTGSIIYAVWSARKLRNLDQRVSYQERFNEVRKELYEKLTDPEKIASDFAASEVEVVEVKYPQRTTAPREDAGAPAKIHKPLLRGVKRGSWNQPGSEKR
jgi:hypothetical protein